MEENIHIIVQYTPECFGKFHGYLQNNHNIDNDDEILQFILEQSNNESMSSDGCIVYIDDGELEMEETGPINHLLREDTQQYKHVIEPCNINGGGIIKIRRKQKRKSKRSTKSSHKKTKKVRKRRQTRRKHLRKKRSQKGIKTRYTRTKHQR